MTETEDGRVKPLQEKELFRSQKYATAIYRINLAERLQKLGYEIEVDRKGAPQIKGFSQEYLDASSPRRKEVEREAAEMKERLEVEGVSVKEGAGLNQAAALADRRSKKFDHEEMKARHQEMDARFGNEARLAVEQAKERGPIVQKPEEIEKHTQTAVTFARDNAMEREAVADWRRLKMDAYRRGMALTTYDSIEKEIASRQTAGEFVGIVREHEPGQMTTQNMLDLELSNIKTVLDAKGNEPPIVPSNQIQETMEQMMAAQEIKLNRGQQSAIEEILTSRDRIIALQGGAGTGKTTVLRTIRQAAVRAWNWRTTLASFRSAGSPR